MDDQRFDRLTRTLAAARDRRSFLRGVAGGILGLAVATPVVAATTPNNAGKAGPSNAKGCAAVCANRGSSGQARTRCGCGPTTTTTTTSAPTTTTPEPTTTTTQEPTTTTSTTADPGTTTTTTTTVDPGTTTVAPI